MVDENEILVELEALAVGGAMVGRIISGAGESLGKKAFIAGGLPGETVRALVTKESKGYVEAQLVAIEKQSSDRVEPACPFFVDCGGCQLQHIPIDLQRELKRELVEKFLAVRKLVPRSPIILLDSDLPDWNYRNRVTLHMNAIGELGFYEKGSGTVVPIDACMIAASAINQAIPVIKEACREVAHLLPSIVIEETSSEIQVVFKMHHHADDEAVARVVASVGSLFDRVFVKRGRKMVFRSDSAADAAGHFSQVNCKANEALVAAVCERLDPGVVDDLYAGSGNFSIPLAEQNRSVRAVELDSVLVKRGRADARRRGLSGKLEFVEARCEQFVKTEQLRSQVLLDPPRAGARAVVERINSSATGRVLYVSCSLPTFARDAAILVEKGYKLEETVVLDMFPHTHHVELLSCFARS